MTLSKHKSVALSLATGGLLLVGLLMLVRGAPPTARADRGTWFVAPDGAGDCSQAHPCDLPTALSAAGDGDAIYMAKGTYTGTGAAVISLTEAVSLYGGWDGVATGEPHRNPASYVTKLDGEGIRRVAYITGSIAPVLDGLVIANGNAIGLGGWNTSDVGGGIYIHSASPLITGCTIVSNSAGPASMTGVGTGGGLFLFESDARLEHSRIISNTARWGGGARVVSGGPALRHNLFLSNTSLFGGGAYLMWAEGLVEDSLFQSNSADFGGGLYLSGCSSTIRGNLIRQNQAGVGGGIGINGGTSPVIVSGNRILVNEANYVGGGVNVQRNDAHLENNFVARNEAPRGGGIHLEKASFVLRHNTLASNVGADGGGALVGEDAAVVLSNTILVSHAVGISVTTGSTATLEATLWYKNGSDTGGAGAIDIGAVNIWGDPTFVDPAGWDYHLLGGSPAIDAGVDAGMTSDIDGDRRPQGTGYDIGADEYPLSYRIYLPLVRR
jgi:hypothetical protein